VAPVVKPLTEATRLETDAELKREEASMRISQSRRAFLAAMSAVGAVTVLRSRSTLADEGPPEVTTIRIRRDPGEVKMIGGGVDTQDCISPEYVAKELLIEEGFTDVKYVSIEGGDVYSEAFQRDELDLGLMSPGGIIGRIESGVPIKVLAGIHPGCFELFVHEQIKTVEDLKGKQVGIDGPISSTPGQFVTFFVASAGLDPEKDIRWVTPDGGADPLELFMDGKIDAYMAFMPHAQGLHERNMGRVLIDLARTEPWSKTFCCLTVGRTGFVQDSPIATKRALRALLKATDICAQEPQKAAQRLVDGGFVRQYENAYNLITDLRYDAWRSIDAEHSLRFYAGQLQQIGQLKTNPDQVIADGTDFSFLNGLKRELKA
jgi:NitT/TauT family transport system substrate-binding protein